MRERLSNIIGAPVFHKRKRTSKAQRRRARRMKHERAHLDMQHTRDQRVVKSAIDARDTRARKAIGRSRTEARRMQELAEDATSIQVRTNQTLTPRAGDYRVFVSGERVELIRAQARESEEE